MLNKNKNTYKSNDFYTPDRKIKISQPNTRLIGIFLAFLLFFNFIAPFIPFFQSFFKGVQVKTTITPPSISDALITDSITPLANGSALFGNSGGNISVNAEVLQALMNDTAPNTLLVAHCSEIDYTQGYIIQSNKIGSIYLCGIELGYTYTITLTSSGITKIDDVEISQKSYNLTVNNPVLNVNIHLRPTA